MSLSCQHRVCTWKETDGLQDLIECGKEGKLESKASYCELYQPVGISFEFYNVLYLTDYRLSCPSSAQHLFTPQHFYSAMGNLMRAFSIQKKGETVFLQWS